MALTVGQLIMDAQRMASRVKELDALSSALLVEAEGNNRYVESLRQYQDEVDSLNRIANNKTNVEMVNRIQQQNANSSEILKENRELKVCIEDYERAMDLIMQKYREHTSSKVLESKLNFKEVYNEKLWKIIREQREKINEMAAVMQRAASIDDDCDLELITRLRLENKALRELLQISKQFGTFSRPIRFNEHLLEEKGVQTDYSGDDSADELSLSGASIENANNNSVIQLDTRSTSPNVAMNCSNTGHCSILTKLAMWAIIII
ncbi:FGFR1 oncogene partner 2 homolog [Musca vetustissima]|uniref:FGFR1 oncogene partner 2 homolog n=1 Tax=Musca vetustissima TaxID=27455 RepID=UPI002AB6074A|nr:FGFR1 oncogene partner 2 homolog [Musca vetustissima]